MAQIDQIEVTQGDGDLALKFWSVHPKEIMEAGMTRTEWYAHHIARHRIASEEAAVLRGVKAGLEAASEHVRHRADQFEELQKHGGTDAVVWDEMLTQSTAILALDPQAIAKETPDAD